MHTVLFAYRDKFGVRHKGDRPHFELFTLLVKAWLYIAGAFLLLYICLGEPVTNTIQNSLRLLLDFSTNDYYTAYLRGISQTCVSTAYSVKAIEQKTVLK